jgi:hypothetical protein
MSSINGMNSEVSESELSNILNTTAFDTIAHATAGALPNEKTASDFVEINGRSYLTVSRTANQRTSPKPSWIWDHGRELRLLCISGTRETFCIPISSLGTRVAMAIGQPVARSSQDLFGYG